MKCIPAAIAAILFVSQSSFSAPADKKGFENPFGTSFLSVQLTPEIPAAPSYTVNSDEEARSGQYLFMMRSANSQSDCPRVIKIGAVTLVKRCPDQ